jgi:hypothetical protein
MFISKIYYYYDWDILRYTDENGFGRYIKFWLLIFSSIFLIINIISTLVLLNGIDYIYEYICIEKNDDIILFLYEYENRKD